MHHAVNAVAVFAEELLDDRRVSARWAHDRIADSHVGVGQHVGHLVRATVKILLVGRGIDGLGIFLKIVRAEQVVACTGQAVAANTRVLESFVGRLAS